MNDQDESVPPVLPAAAPASPKNRVPAGHIIIPHELRPADSLLPVEATPFLPTARENWLWLMKMFGWLPFLYIGYRAAQGTLDLGARFLVVTFGILAYEGCLFLVGAAIVPLRQLDKKRLARFVAEGDLTSLLGFVYSAMTFSDWQRGCDGIVRLGPAVIPHLTAALDPEARVLQNPLGRSLPSNSNLRAAVVFCLGRLKAKTAAESIRRRLDDPAFAVRQHTCDALAELNDEAALPKLKELAEHDSNEEVRKSAAAAIARITGTPIPPP